MKMNFSSTKYECEMQAAHTKTVWNSTGVHTGIEFSEFNKRIFCIFFDNRAFLPDRACNPFYSGAHCNKLLFVFQIYSNMLTDFS